MLGLSQEGEGGPQSASLILAMIAYRGISHIKCKVQVIKTCVKVKTYNCAGMIQLYDTIPFHHVNIL